LRRLAQWHLDNPDTRDATQWLELKGIGQWTVDYARMRGASHPDIWLGGDLGVKKALGELGDASPTDASPWRSYLTFQLWNR
jgi:AraC family transcriptional regulator of adaptative response / DNA-3-methyladenine glycosylase II